MQSLYAAIHFSFLHILNTHWHFITGDICPAGHFCPQGTITPHECPPGQFCKTTRLSKPSGNCSSGYYCTGKAVVATQHDCTVGHYCPVGSHKPWPCPEGTFSNATLNREEGQCSNCTAGYYCAGQGNHEVTGQCSEG